MKKMHFDIQGMSCASCQAHVTKAVEKLEGTKNVNVNLLTNDMTVDIDENKIDGKKIIQAIENAGYGASISSDSISSDSISSDSISSDSISSDSISNKNIPNNNIASNNDSGDNTSSDSEITVAEREASSLINTHSSTASTKSFPMRNRVQESNDLAIKNMKSRLIISLIFWIPLMIIAMHKMLHISMPAFDGIKNSLIFALVQFMLTVPIMIANKNLLKNGFKSLLKFAPNMDALVAIGSTASFIYGCISIFKMAYGFGYNDLNLVNKSMSNLYFDSAGTILTLITVGKFFEAKSKGKTGDAITKLINLAPKTSIVIREGKEEVIPTEEILVNDIIVIKPGTSIPVDGVVIEGSTSINQSSITGESIPVEKNVGDEVISGTINENGYIKMKATKVGAETTLSKIVKLVEEASVSKAPIENLADKIAYYFVPIIITIAIATLFGWIIAGESMSTAFNFAISVLVISCPCALGLATPVAIMVGTGRGAESGILFKTAEALQTLGEVKYVIFDKTGTITKGKPKVTDIISEINEQDFLKIAYSLEKSSEHPLAKAVVEKAKENLAINSVCNDEKNKCKLNGENNYQSNNNKCIINSKESDENFEVQDFLAVAGKGVEAEINGKKYYTGNVKLMKENNIETAKYNNKASKLLSEGKTVLYIACEKELIGLIGVADTIKDDSRNAVTLLNFLGIKTVMITGDNKVVANEIAKQVGIKNVYSEVLPQHKEQIVSNLQKGNPVNVAKVAFVGDGINDSPALAKSDVGIAIGSGTDIAIDSADIILVRDSLIDVVNAIKLSKKTLKNVKENLFWAFFYNAICIPLAAGLLYKSFGLELNPMIGSLAMSLSSLFVVTNALRLRFVKMQK